MAAGFARVQRAGLAATVAVALSMFDADFQRRHASPLKRDRSLGWNSSHGCIGVAWVVPSTEQAKLRLQTEQGIEKRIMTKKLTVAGLALLGILFLWSQQSSLLAAPTLQSSTSTPVATQEPMEENEATTEPSLAQLGTRIDALEAQVAALTSPAAHAVASPNEVTTAVYLLDTAGLHDIDVRLNEEGVINPADAGAVTRIARLLPTVDWPESLAEDAAALTDLLTQLAAALTEDDVETAAPLAAQVHEAQHDFSHAAEHWLGEATLPAETQAAGQAFRVTSAVYLLDTAGLHDIDVRLNEEGVIEPSDAGTVARVARLLPTVDWPESLAEDAATLTDLLTQLAAALTEDDVETAAPLATQVHEAQHDFSHAAEHWLGEASGEHGDEAAEGDDHAAGEEEDHGEEEEAPESSGGS
jgi:acetone carboxylase gamma subunit